MKPSVQLKSTKPNWKANPLKAQKGYNMKKVKYYKAMGDGKKRWFVESWGQLLKIALPSGHILELACEFKRGYGWRVTDISSGYLAQHKRIDNKTEMNAYYQDKDILDFFDRERQRDQYKKAQENLAEYKKQFTE